MGAYLSIIEEPVGFFLVATIVCLIIIATAVTIALAVFKNRPVKTLADIPPKNFRAENSSDSYLQDTQTRLQEVRLQFTSDLMSMREDFIEYERRTKALIQEQTGRFEQLTLALAVATKNMAGLERECGDVVRCMNALIAEVRSAATKTQALSEEVERQRRSPFRS